MPTRLVIRESNINGNQVRTPSQANTRDFRRSTELFPGDRRSHFYHSNSHNNTSPNQQQQQQQRHGAQRIGNTPTNNNNKFAVGSNNSRDRKVVGFRSSILRDFSKKRLEGIMEEGDETNTSYNAGNNKYGDESNNGGVDEDLLHLSNDDIRASPRLLGYLFGMIAASVMLVSVLRFYDNNGVALKLGTNIEAYRNCKNINVTEYNNMQNQQLLLAQQQQLLQQDDPDNPYNITEHSNEPITENNLFFCSDNGPVYYWKLYGAFIIALLGVIIFFFILLVHFDTILFPRVWFKCFRDGSKYERNILTGLLVFWAIGLHLSTSSLSVGEVQANVFFTTWISFGSTALNYGVWREGASLPSIAERVNYHIRETTYNWFWMLLFQLITAGAATDLYFSRFDITLRYRGKIINLNDEQWNQVLIMMWSLVAVCFVSLFLNHVWIRPWKLYFGSSTRIVVSWRYLEGLIILSMVGAEFYIILEYTGVDGVVSGLNNAYFGLWGAFFNSCFALGTWLRENKDIDLL